MHASPSDTRNLDLDLDGAAARAAQVAADARAALGHPIDRARTVAHDVTSRTRAAARAAVAHASGYARHLGDLAERYVGAKIKRRVKPPIVLALVVAGVALVVAVAAIATRRR